MASGRKPGRRPALSAHEAQAAVEGVVLPVDNKVSLIVQGVVVGEYRMADRVGLMPLLRFAHVSSKGVDSADMEGLAALYDMIRDSIHEDEWSRFVRDATDAKAEDEDLLGVVKRVIESLSARPSGSPSGSQHGRRSTSASSKASSRRTDTGPDDGLVSVDSLLDR